MGKLLNIYEYVIKEMLFTTHLVDRLEDRLDDFYDDEISPETKRFVSKYLRFLETVNFTTNKSFAIKLVNLEINPKSEIYVNINGREYYSIEDFMGKDSTGNQIWVIIRNNKAVTVMLRKEIQPTYKMGVDYIINSKAELMDYVKRGLIKV